MVLVGSIFKPSWLDGLRGDGRFVAEPEGGVHHHRATGDFDPNAVRAQLQTLFTGWKSPVANAPIRSRYTDVAAVRERFAAPDKPNAVLMGANGVRFSFSFRLKLTLLPFRIVRFRGDHMTPQNDRSANSYYLKILVFIIAAISAYDAFFSGGSELAINVAIVLSAIAFFAFDGFRKVSFLALASFYLAKFAALKVLA